MTRSDSSTDRAVSTTFGYVLALSVTTLLVTGLLFAAGGVVGDQRERAIRTELQVVGQQIAADVQAGDRLVGAGVTGFTVRRDLPDEVAGSTYTVAVVVDDPTGYSPPPRETYVRLTSSRLDVTVEVDVVLQSDVEEASFEGGELVVTYDTGTSALEVDDAG